MARVKGRKYGDLYPKERQLLQKIASGKTPKEAAKMVYATNGNESAVVNRVFRRQRFLTAYEKSGASATSLIKTIVEGTKADRLYFYNKEKIPWPDWFARLAFIKLILKIQGVIDEEPAESQTNHEPLIVAAIKYTDNRSVTINEAKKKDKAPLISETVTQDEDTTPQETSV